MEDLGKTYGDNLLFKDVNLTVGRGEKIALLGPNGVGKSTLLKRIMKTLDGDGTVNYGHNVQVTYFAQDQAEALDKEKTILETVDEVAKGEIRKELRSVLGAFLFSGEDVDKKVGVLSGGERTRLALCQLLLSPSNVLILDEPTNHLDIQSKEVLKNALINYEGTFIIVSHDREFLDGLTNRIWDIEDKALKIHHFTVQEFLQRKMSLNGEHKAQKKAPKPKKEEEKKVEEKKPEMSYEEAKELKRQRNKFKNQVNKAEQNIERLEKEIAEMDKVLADLDYTDEENSAKQLAKYESLKADLDQEMMAWEEGTEQLMELEN